MELLLGATTALGVLLCASPWLWPRGQERPRRREHRLHRRIRDRVAQAGLAHVPVLAVVAVSLVGALLLAGIALLLTGVIAVVPIAAGVGAALPWLGISARARRRRRHRSEVWPEVIDHIVAGVRSGLPIPEALSGVAVNGPIAVRPEFSAYAVDYRATGSFSYCVERLKESLADPVADRLLETLRMGREVGGTETGSVLRQLGSFLRAEQAMRGELIARQSWIAYAARLGLVAPWIVLIALSLRPETAAAYNSPGGLVVILAGAVVTLIAYRVMIVIGRLPEEARFFA